MAFTYNLEKDIRYRQGIEKGREEGLEEGLEKGVEQSKIEFVSNLLLAGEFSDGKIAALASVTIDFIEKVRASLMEAGKLKK